MITSIPNVEGFRPHGRNRRMRMAHRTNAVIMHHEEYEALKLMDYEMFTQVEAAGFMKVSRPTFTRVYLSARRKIAKAFVEGRQIIIEGGNVRFDEEMLKCDDCSAIFNLTGRESEILCPICRSDNIGSALDFDN